MSELKPCPFCGGKAKYFLSKIAEMATLQTAAVRCTNCLTTSAPHPVWPGENDGSEWLTEKWNKRE